MAVKRLQRTARTAAPRCNVNTHIEQNSIGDTFHKSHLRQVKTKKNLILLGMMGVGKSTVGKYIAKKLKIKFFDMDKLVEKKNGMKIKDIFETQGEIYFRKN